MFSFPIYKSDKESINNLKLSQESLEEHVITQISEQNIQLNLINKNVIKTNNKLITVRESLKILLFEYNKSKFFKNDINEKSNKETYRMFGSCYKS